MGHYLSDLLPDPSIVCLNCQKGVWDKDITAAWIGYLEACQCRKPDPCPVDDVDVVELRKIGFKWVRKARA